MSFPVITLLDSFKREETPLSNGGKWKIFFPVSGTGHCIGGIDWESSSSPTEGAYWSPAEFLEPGVAICRDRRIDDAGFWSIWACMASPTTSEISGYCLKFELTTSESGGTIGVFTVKLERCTKNSFTVLAEKIGEKFKSEDRIGLAVQAGKVSYWHKEGEVGSWVERASASDSTYTKGFVGFAAKSANGDTTNFEAAGASGSPSIENPGTQHSRVFKETSLQIHAKSAITYIATNLPVGLSINETSGLITGEPTTVESPFVKITVENGSESAEVGFEWVVTEGRSDIVGMIL